MAKSGQVVTGSRVPPVRSFCFLSWRCSATGIHSSLPHPWIRPCRSPAARSGVLKLLLRSSVGDTTPQAPTSPPPLTSPSSGLAFPAYSAQGPPQRLCSPKLARLLLPESQTATKVRGSSPSRMQFCRKIAGGEAVFLYKSVHGSWSLAAGMPTAGLSVARDRCRFPVGSLAESWTTTSVDDTSFQEVSCCTSCHLSTRVPRWVA